ncbi:YciI family protein [Glaciihabitans sp. UYNi722]|uniref:YciI family protein n=1 Tax=Glaciihabitans sp. UYNi722 TaxID=3156344 RepID=UPI003397ABF1
MKYMITIYNNDAANVAIEGADLEEFRQVHDDIQAELRASGELVDSNELSVTDARVVRTGDGEITITDGPFTEGAEIVGGYYLVDVDGVDRAIEIAARFVEARFTPVEVRALVHG